MVPEDDVADEPVRPAGAQAASRARRASARGRSAARRSPRSRSPSTTATDSATGSGACRRTGRRRAPPRPSSPREHPVAERRKLARARARAPVHTAVRCIPRKANAVSTARRPARASRPGQVSPQVTPPTNPWRAASTIWVAGLYLATVWSQPLSRASGAYAVVVRIEDEHPGLHQRRGRLRLELERQRAPPEGGEGAHPHDDHDRDRQPSDPRPAHPEREADHQQDRRRDQRPQAGRDHQAGEQDRSAARGRPAAGRTSPARCRGPG